MREGEGREKGGKGGGMKEEEGEGRREGERIRER